VPLHFVSVDLAGNITKRFAGSGVALPTNGGMCPRSAVCTAFLIPGQIRSQVSQLPDGTSYFCIARTVAHGAKRHGLPAATHSVAIGCRLEHASHFVYAKDIDLAKPPKRVAAGLCCGTCSRCDCDVRAWPRVAQPLSIDENVRGVSIFTGPLSDPN
jgi:hypothetical protein